MCDFLNNLMDGIAVTQLPPSIYQNFQRICSVFFPWNSMETEITNGRLECFEIHPFSFQVCCFQCAFRTVVSLKQKKEEMECLSVSISNSWYQQL